MEQFIIITLLLQWYLNCEFVCLPQLSGHKNGSMGKTNRLWNVFNAIAINSSSNISEHNN
jgi:hypothetical protein